MEHLPAFGKAISEVIVPTYQTYAPLLVRQADDIRSTPCKTFDYGPHERQKLDVYTPAAGRKPVNGNANSILMFLYGGGLIRGDKTIAGVADGLVYANLGHYFAENLGFPVAIVDYRLISHGAKFPSGGEDAQLAVDWTLKQYAQDSTDPLHLYMMGNSAGGIHISTYLLAPDFQESRQRILGDAGGKALLKGVVLLAVPVDFEQADPSRKDVLEAYYGSAVQTNCPFGLLKTVKSNGSIDDLARVPVLALTGTLDPEDEVLIPNAKFEEVWRSVPSVEANLTTKTMEGHNHISPVLGLSTGIASEEEWGRQVVEFIAA